MTKISIPNESSPTDKRTAMTPNNVGKMVRAGADMLVEAGLGVGCGYADEEYLEAGARVIGERQVLFAEADVVLRIHKPTADEIAQLKAVSYPQQNHLDQDAPALNLHR